MADTDRLTGKSSYFTYNGVNIPFTKMTPTVNRKLADSTDSGDYNQTQDMLTTTQIPAAYTLEGTIEGRFRLSVIPTIVAQTFTSLTQVPIVIGLDASPTVWGHGVVDISNFKTDIPVDDIINFTADIKSWGTFTPNS